MNYDEMGIILAFLTTVYTNRLIPKIDNTSIEIWQSLLEDISFNDAQTAVKAWAQTNQYPPTIADIREMVCNKFSQDDMTADEAWKKVHYAMVHFSIYEKDEAINYLGDLWKFVSDWRYYCTMLEEQVPYEKSRFLKAYNEELSKQRYRRQLSEPVRKAIGGITIKQIEEVSE
jgi:hypothetical protein